MNNPIEKSKESTLFCMAEALFHLYRVSTLLNNLTADSSLNEFNRLEAVASEAHEFFKKYPSVDSTTAELCEKIHDSIHRAFETPRREHGWEASLVEELGENRSYFTQAAEAMAAADFTSIFAEFEESFEGAEGPNVKSVAAI